MAGLEGKLTNQSPLQLLDKKYPDKKEQHARLLWHQFPPIPSHPPCMRGDLPGKQEEEESLT